MGLNYTGPNPNAGFAIQRRHIFQYNDDGYFHDLSAVNGQFAYATPLAANVEEFVFMRTGDFFAGVNNGNLGGIYDKFFQIQMPNGPFGSVVEGTQATTSNKTDKFGSNVFVTNFNNVNRYETDLQSFPYSYLYPDSFSYRGGMFVPGAGDTSFNPAKGKIEFGSMSGHTGQIPIVLDSGSLCSVPVNGAIEIGGNYHFYGTNQYSGFPTRSAFVQQGDSDTCRSLTVLSPNAIPNFQVYPFNDTTTKLYYDCDRTLLFTGRGLNQVLCASYNGKRSDSGQFNAGIIIGDDGTIADQREVSHARLEIVGGNQFAQGSIPLVLRPGHVFNGDASERYGAIENDGNYFWGTDTAKGTKRTRAFVQQGDTVLTANGLDTFSYNSIPAFASVWTDTNGVLKLLPLSGTFYGFRIYHAGYSTSNITPIVSDTAGIKLAVRTIGNNSYQYLYKVSWNISLKSSTSDTVHCHIYTNGTQIEEGSAEQYFSAASTIATMGASAIVLLDQVGVSDTLSLRLSASTPASSLTINHAELNIVKIGMN